MKLTKELFTDVVSAYSAGVKVRDIARNLGLDVRWVLRCAEKADRKFYKDKKYDMQS